MDQIVWTQAGATGRLGSVATLKVPESCRFTDGDGSRIFAEGVQNLPNPQAIGLLVCRLSTDTSDDPAYWFAEYSYSADGYIKDAASEKLDADAILQVVREGTAKGNEERRARGWSTMEVLGWEKTPFYDPRTNNATWAIIGLSSDDNSQSVNHRVRLLGRRGVLAINMIAGPTEYAAAVADLDRVVATTEYVPGEKYSEFQEGDKVAEYGLTALIAGGAGAAAAKLGLFGKLWKFLVALAVGAWKLVFAAAIGILGWIASLFKTKAKPQPASKSDEQPPALPE
jgi:uncharacterized membrane-anchored protein